MFNTTLRKLGLTAALTLTVGTVSAQNAHTAQATLRADQPGATVNRNVFGQFAEHLGFGIYGGIWVGEDSPIPNTRGYRNDVVAALRQLEVPVVRWPGGCFADEYHWREGIGPRNQRPIKVNTHWGGVEENNAFGTHEFMDFAELIGADAYVSGNVGNGSPQEIADWVEYITSDTHSTLANERRANGRDKPWKLPYFGLGNELWGCGGNMRAEYAADVHRRYQTFVKPHGQRTVKVAAGANSDDYHWTEVFMRDARGHTDALSLHYYTVPSSWPPRRSSYEFREDEWIEVLSRTLFMDELISRHSAIMDRYDPQKRIGLYVDEWGTWYAGLPGVNPGFLHQQNTLRDALVAALNFNIFSVHAERVTMTNIAQMVNVLQAMILTQDEKMLLTPTYHVFEMYKPYMDASVLPLELTAPKYEFGEYSVPAVHGSAVRGKDGAVYVALTNLDPNRPVRVSASIRGERVRSASGRILTAPNITSHNTFERPDAVRPVAFTGARVSGDTLNVELPAKSVVMLQLR